MTHRVSALDFRRTLFGLLFVTVEAVVEMTRTVMGTDPMLISSPSRGGTGAVNFFP